MQVHKYKNAEELSNSFAEWLVNYINEALQKQDRFTLALSGGSTPKKLHHLLASDAYKGRVDWTKLHIFWGDERYVPFEDDRNNAKMAYDTLLNFVNIPAEQIHVMRTDIPQEESAIAYEKILVDYFHDAAFTFDLVILGMGDDGHTLSLFPGKTEVIHEQKKWCITLWLDSQDMYRITLTAPVVNLSARVAFLAAGANKAKVLHEVLKGAYNPDLYPSQMIRPEAGELHWFIDEAAGELL